MKVWSNTAKAVACRQYLASGRSQLAFCETYRREHGHGPSPRALRDWLHLYTDDKAVCSAVKDIIRHAQEELEDLLVAVETLTRHGDGENGDAEAAARRIGNDVDPEGHDQGLGDGADQPVEKRQLQAADQAAPGIVASAPPSASAAPARVAEPLLPMPAQVKRKRRLFTEELLLAADDDSTVALVDAAVEPADGVQEEPCPPAVLVERLLPRPMPPPGFWSQPY